MLKLSMLVNSMPSSLLNTAMKLVVRHAYDINDYNDVYRRRDYLTDFEEISIQRFLKAINIESPKLLDVGCGSGKPYDQYFATMNCRLVGIDISKKQIERAMNNVPTAEYINVDFLRYESQDKFDGIVMLYSLFHVNRKYHSYLLKKVFEMLNDDGRILLNVRKESNDLKYRSNFCGKPMFWSHFDYKTFKRIVKDIGFKLQVLGDENGHDSSESHLWIILSKRMTNRSRINA